MKRIEFISPVAAIRGNMSGTQQLKYPLHDNRAFEGPDGSVNYARNYRPSYIGTKRASDGRCSFQTKRKSANHLTTKAKSAMANLGGVGAIYSALVRDKSAQLYLDAQLCYAAAVANGYEGTFRKFMYSYIKPALDAKNATIDITIGAASVSINNPWVFGGTGSDVSVRYDLIAKFFAQLNPDPIFFKLVVNTGEQIIVIYDKLFAQQGMTWRQYLEESIWNTTTLFIADYDPYPIYGIYNGEEGVIVYADFEVLASDNIVNNANYSIEFGG